VLTLASGNSEITIKKRQSLAQFFSLLDGGHFPNLARFSVGFPCLATCAFADQQGHKRL